jgi:hypothetical protein
MNTAEVMLRYAENLLKHGDREAMAATRERLEKEARRARLETWTPPGGAKPQRRIAETNHAALLSW